MFSITDQRRRTGALVAFAIMTVAGLACGGSKEDSTVSAACGAFAELDSYRYAISVKMQLPGLGTDPAGQAPALGGFADSLSAILSDFKIDGAYVAPDRRQAVIDFGGDQMELRVVGGKRWERFGSGWGTLGADTPSIGNLAPDVVCTELVADLAPGLSRVAAEEEDINGVPVHHFAVDETNIEWLPALLGLEDGKQLPQQFSVEAWFASDGDWPVRLDVCSQANDSQGATGTVEFGMVMRDVNDSGIKIEAPGAPAGG
jgi:hypothetical protein